MATLARYQAEKRSKNKETEEAITKLSENLGRLNWKPLWKFRNFGLLSSRKKIKEIEEAIKTFLSKQQPWPVVKPRKDRRTKKQRKPYLNCQKTLPDYIENLSANMATLAYCQAEKKIKEIVEATTTTQTATACYQAEKRSKNKETEEAITKLSENLVRLNWQPLC